MIAAAFQDITKKYGNLRVLTEVTCQVPEGSFAVIFGPPGCGKSVLLRLLTGLEKANGGRVFLRGEDVTGMTPGERGVGYVPQSFALYPHFRVYDNIAYPLKLVGEEKDLVDRQVRQAADMLRISPLLQKYPDQLSGGEKQRVALARGITKQTEIYVFDDPLSGLDFKLREQLVDDLREMQRSLGATFVYTTSDALEALMLADQIFILDRGAVVESGPLAEVYERPGHVRTMELLGFPKANTIRGEVTNGGEGAVCSTPVFEIPFVKSPRSILNGREVLVCVRPQGIRLAKPAGKAVSFDARVLLREDLGAELVLHLEAGGLRLQSVLRHEDERLAAEDQVHVYLPLEEIVLYSPEDGHRVGQGGEHA
ncbi:MAG: ABC transporter ATP-binding protein [Spirochaetota bacterium]